MILKRLLLLVVSFFFGASCNKFSGKSFPEDLLQEAQRQRSIKEGNDAWKWKCTNGKDPLFLSIRAYMIEFGKGPCSPIVLLPGMLASILQVQITDCEAFRQANPTTFAACNWTTCAGGPNSPASEYRIWAPDPNTPMNVLSSVEIEKQCFAGLIEAVFSSPSGKFTPGQQPGIQVTVRGLTPGTQNSSACGLTSTENMIPGLVNPEATENFKLIVSRLIDMGYKSGLTAQAVPYDFRMPTGYDGASKNLGAIISLLHKFTNKKVVIAAHSMGNLKTAYGLWNMAQQDKDSMIQMYLALAPPYIGATKPVSYLTCGSNELFFPFNIGLDMKTWKVLAGTWPTIFELSPRLTYASQASQPWMQQIMQRIQYENGQSSDPVFSFLPTKSQLCYPNFSKATCQSGLEVLDNYGTLTGQPITNANLYQWLDTYSFSANTANMWTLLDSRFETLQNINVPTTIVYASVVPTEGKFTFNQDPRITADQNKFCNNKQMSWSPWLGDDTVPSTSAVTAALKWANEFITGTPNAKPIKMVDVCSAVNNRLTPYDSKNSSGAFQMSSVEYQGLPCDCSEGKYRHCTHTGMILLPALLDYLSTSLTPGDVQPVSEMVNSMTDFQLQDFLTSCTIFKLSTVNSKEYEHDALLEISRQEIALKKLKDLLQKE